MFEQEEKAESFKQGLRQAAFTAFHLICNEGMTFDVFLNGIGLGDAPPIPEKNLTKEECIAIAERIDRKLKAKEK